VGGGCMGCCERGGGGNNRGIIAVCVLLLCDIHVQDTVHRFCLLQKEAVLDDPCLFYFPLPLN